jgi:hypothetical protein
MSFVRLSTPKCAFIPKYHWLMLGTGLRDIGT